MNHTVLILLPGCEPRQTFDLWWQGATAVAFGETDATLPVPPERVFRSVCLLQLWLLWRRFDRVVVTGNGAAELAHRLSARRVAALPLRIA